MAAESLRSAPNSDLSRAFARQPMPAGEIEPEIVARLEWLDDVIFSAIEGDATALDNATAAWQEVLDELGPEVLEESRRQYLSRAHAVWESLRNQVNHPPHKVFAAIEVISLLAGKAW